MKIGSTKRLYIFKSFSCVCFLAVAVTQSGCALFSKDRGISSDKPTYSQNEPEGKAHSEDLPVEKEIDLKTVFPDEDIDLNTLFPDMEMKRFLKIMVLLPCPLK